MLTLYHPNAEKPEQRQSVTDREKVTSGLFLFPACRELSGGHTCHSRPRLSRASFFLRWGSGRTRFRFPPDTRMPSWSDRSHHIYPGAPHFRPKAHLKPERPVLFSKPINNTARARLQGARPALLLRRLGLEQRVVCNETGAHPKPDEHA